MKREFGFAFAIKPDRKADRTHIDVRITVPRVLEEPSPEWEKYLAECQESLDRAADKESIEILAWSTDLDFEDELAVISHHVTARGLLPGRIPLSFTRALSPARGYASLEFLSCALRNGWPIDAVLKRSVESNYLQRYDRNGKRLADPLPAHLLAIAILESGWRGLVSPSDNPWAYINQVTQRIYQRGYTEGNGSADPLELVTELSQEQNRESVDATIAGDGLAVENIRDILRSVCSEDAVSVAMARAEGKKWNELPAHLSGLTGTCWDHRRVEAARGSFRRQKGKLRACALKASQWKRPNGGTVYRERLPDGEAWNGHWTYTHSLQSENLEVHREVIANERRNLFRSN